MLDEDIIVIFIYGLFEVPPEQIFRRAEIDSPLGGIWESLGMSYVRFWEEFFGKTGISNVSNGLKFFSFGALWRAHAL